MCELVSHTEPSPVRTPQVYGVEIVKEAVLAAKKNAEENHLTNCEFIAGDVLKVLEETEFPHPDCIVLDPPRDGVHPKALPKILSAEAPTILYISCKPTSLARDLPAFFEAGYQVTRMCAVDMFPRTGNVETCVLLGRESGRDGSKGIYI
ncbi:MAG: methyltransferase domain-containing protein [Lachnospiraceae bacterium]|nr:methyltransferase domain-containing protein [Lachnospiraceae bacterium]